MMYIRNLILIDNTSSNIWLNIPVYAQMYYLNMMWASSMCKMHIYSNTLMTMCMCMLV